eukprot:15361183-Ditylum_brightwellii.AAC.1
MKMVLIPLMLAIAAGQAPLRGNSFQGVRKENCIIEVVALLRIPGEVLSNPMHPGEDINRDVVFECLNDDGTTTVLDINKEQKSAIEGMIKGGSVVPKEMPVDISRATKANDRISLPNEKVNIKNTNQASWHSLATIEGSKRFLAVKVIDKTIYSLTIALIQFLITSLALMAMQLT